MRGSLSREFGVWKVRSGRECLFCLGGMLGWVDEVVDTGRDVECGDGDGGHGAGLCGDTGQGGE